MNSTPSKSLPEKYRKARNIHEGYEIRLSEEDGTHVWLPVKDVLHILAPVKISTFTLDTSGQKDWNDGDAVTVHPNTDVMSRRPAVES